MPFEKIPDQIEPGDNEGISGKDELDLREPKLSKKEVNRMTEQLLRFYENDRKEFRRIENLRERVLNHNFPANDLIHEYNRVLAGASIDEKGNFHYQERDSEESKKKLFYALLGRAARPENWKGEWETLQEVCGSRIPFEHAIRFPEVRSLVLTHAAKLYATFAVRPLRMDKVESYLKDVAALKIFTRREFLSSWELKKALQTKIEDLILEGVRVCGWNINEEDAEDLAEMLEGFVRRPIKQKVIHVAEVLDWKNIPEPVIKKWFFLHKTPRAERKKRLTFKRIIEDANKNTLEKRYKELLKLAAPEAESVLESLRKNDHIQINDWHKMLVPDKLRMSFDNFETRYIKQLAFWQRALFFLKSKNERRRLVEGMFTEFRARQVLKRVRKAELTVNRVRVAYKRAMNEGNNKEFEELYDMYGDADRKLEKVDALPGFSGEEFSAAIKEVRLPLGVSPLQVFNRMSAFCRNTGNNEMMDRVQDAYLRYKERGELIPLAVLFRSYLSEIKEEVLETEEGRNNHHYDLLAIKRAETKIGLPEGVKPEEARDSLLRFMAENNDGPSENQILDAYNSSFYKNDSNDLAIFYRKYILRDLLI